MFFSFPDPDLLYEIPREFQACPRPRQALTQSPQICWLTSRDPAGPSSWKQALMIEFRGIHFNGRPGKKPGRRRRFRNPSCLNPGFQRHVRQNRDQPEPRSEGGMNQKIVASDVSQSRQDGELFVGNVAVCLWESRICEDGIGRARKPAAWMRAASRNASRSRKNCWRVVVEIKGSGTVDEISRTPSSSRTRRGTAARTNRFRRFSGRRNVSRTEENVSHPGDGKTAIPGGSEPVGVFPGRNGGKHDRILGAAPGDCQSTDRSNGSDRLPLGSSDLPKHETEESPPLPARRGDGDEDGGRYAPPLDGPAGPALSAPGGASVEKNRLLRLAQEDISGPVERDAAGRRGSSPASPPATPGLALPGFQVTVKLLHEVRRRSVRHRPKSATTDRALRPGKPGQAPRFFGRSVAARGPASGQDNEIGGQAQRLAPRLEADRRPRRFGKEEGRTPRVAPPRSFHAQRYGQARGGRRGAAGEVASLAAPSR